MPKPSDEPVIVPDSEYRGLLAALPVRWRPYIQLARIDRPIGSWLLWLPGAWAILLAGGLTDGMASLLLWFALGAWAMRGAGCVYNDIVDRDLDARVERTRSRPIASGQVRLRSAWIWLVALCGIGLVVLLQLRWTAQITAVASLALVAAYPFMKRITWWPQAWLGLVFSWAAPVGWIAVRGTIDPALCWLYAGSVCWVIGYDTIYALQDREDDALAGIRSSALRLGGHVRPGVALCYLLAVTGWGMAIWSVRADAIALLALAPVALHLGWQVATLDPDDGENALERFRSNRIAGIVMALACAAVGSAG